MLHTFIGTMWSFLLTIKGCIHVDCITTHKMLNILYRFKPNLSSYFLKMHILAMFFFFLINLHKSSIFVELWRKFCGSLAKINPKTVLIFFFLTQDRTCISISG